MWDVGKSRWVRGWIYGEKAVTLTPERRARAYLNFIFFPGAQNLYCHKGVYVDIEDGPVETFNWTTEKVETCDNGQLCQESVLMIEAGKKRAEHLVGWESR